MFWRMQVAFDETEYTAYNILLIFIEAKTGKSICLVCGPEVGDLNIALGGKLKNNVQWNFKKSRIKTNAILQL